MSIHKLDKTGRPIPAKSKRAPAVKTVRGQRCYHFEIRWKLPAGPDGKQRSRRRRSWLPSTEAAEALDRELRGDAPANALTWSAAGELYREAYEGKRAPAHLGDIARNVRYLADLLGDLPVEDTTLEQYSRFLATREKVSGRTAQLARSHTMSIAKWLRSRGLIERIPFDAAPRAEYRQPGRRPATIDEFHRMARLLPDSMKGLWLAMGCTGARITGMGRLRESDLVDGYAAVTTKRRKIVRYKLSELLLSAIEIARAYKARRKFGADWIFVNSRGEPWDHANFGHALRRLRNKHTEMPPITSHQLRHMWATLAAAKNFSADMIQAALGHDDRRSAETYIDHSQEMADQVAAEVDTLLTPFAPEDGSSGTTRHHAVSPRGKHLQCPCCGAKLLLDNKQARKSK